MLNDDTFIKLKPTIVYVLFGGILVGGLAMGRPCSASCSIGVRPDRGRLAQTHLPLGVFFFALAVLNEIVWRNFPTDTWVSFKLFGMMPLTFLFGAAQYPLLQRYAAKPEVL